MKLTEALYMAALMSIVGRVIDKSPLAGYVDKQCESVAKWYGGNKLAQSTVGICTGFVGSLQTNAFNAIQTFFKGVQRDLLKEQRSTDGARDAGEVTLSV